MNGILPPWPLLATFIAASVLLAVIPGPGVLYIVTRSLLQGRRCGLASVAGVAFGNFGNAIGASLGLAALLALSSTAFLAVKYAGALYLVYLGIRTLCSRRLDIAPEPSHTTLSWRTFRDGFVVALLNPKTSLFFAAFLPQFIVVDGASVFQSIALGALFVVIAAVTDSVYVLVAGAVAPLLTRTRGVHFVQRYVAGGAFIGLGLLTAIAGSRTAK
jgi:threonine/homoserine/homoserine lactone efflux protein